MKKYEFFLNYIFFNNKYIIIIFLFLFFLITQKLCNYKKRPKISIFIPIYNKENCIKKCIQSLQNQTLKDIEIIAVNDRSNDNSLCILNDLAKKDHRIKVINNDKNHGLLYSRAMGILNSSGEYLMNLDSDDELHDNESLEFLYKQTQLFNVDIIQFSVLFKVLNMTIKCWFNNKILYQPKLYKSNFFDNNEVNDYLIWNKLIKKETFLKAYEIFKIAIYNGKWNYFEDDVWTILVNKYAKSKICLDKLIYIYNDNNNSLMHNRYTNIEFQNLLYRHEMYKYIFKKKEEEKYLIAEYNYLFNRIKSDLKFLLLINDNNIKKRFKNIFEFYIKKFNCSEDKKNDISKLLKILPG